MSRLSFRLKRISLARMLLVRRAMLWSALIGLFTSTYLLITYVSGRPIACGPLAGGCDIVRASKWAFTFGIPRPALGVMFYVAVITLLTIRVYSPQHKPKMWTALTIVATTAGFVESAFLFVVQWLDIRAFCLWCLLSAVAATALFVLGFFEGDEDPDRAVSLRELRFIFTSFLIAIIGGAVVLWFLLTPRVGGGTPSLQPAASPRTISAANLLSAVTPVSGPATSTVLLVEFLDPQCPACRLLFPIMEKIRAEYGGRIRIAQRLFPLPELHPKAEDAAISVLCANQQGAYDGYMDAALLNQDSTKREDFIHFADALKLDVKKFEACLDDASIANTVLSERKAGDALGLQSTPTIFVNDKMIEGVVSYEQINQVIEGEMGGPPSP